MGCCVRTKHSAGPLNVRRNLLEHAQPLAAHRRLKILEARYAAARSCQASDKSAIDRFRDLGEYNWNCAWQLVKLLLAPDHPRRQSRPVRIPLAPPPRSLRQRRCRRSNDNRTKCCGRRSNQGSARHRGTPRYALGLLYQLPCRPREERRRAAHAAARAREREVYSRAAEQRDELAAFHSITSSAFSRRPSGTSIPIVPAVFRLITQLNLVGF